MARSAVAGAVNRNAKANREVTWRCKSSGDLDERNPEPNGNCGAAMRRGKEAAGKTPARLAEAKASFEGLDTWLRRKLRCIVWRQWKRHQTRHRELRRHGLDEARARASAFNGR